MHLTKEFMDAKIDEHFQFEANDDVDGVVSTLAENATHDTVGWPTGPIHGAQNTRPFYTQLFADIAGEKVTPVKRLYGDNFMVDESLWEGRATGMPFGLEGRNRPLSFRILHIFEFTEDGDIARENVWLDMAAIQQQLPQD